VVCCCNAWQLGFRVIDSTRMSAIIVLRAGTSTTVFPQDVIIEETFSLAPLPALIVIFTSQVVSRYEWGRSSHNEFPSVLPSLNSGSIVRYVDMTGCVGLFSGNRVGGSVYHHGFGAA